MSVFVIVVYAFYSYIAFITLTGIDYLSIGGINIVKSFVILSFISA